MVDRVVRVRLVGDATSLVREAERAAGALRGLANTNLGGLNNGLRASARGATEASSAWDKLKDSVAGHVAVGNLISSGVGGAFSIVTSAVKEALAAGLDYENNMNTLRSAIASTGASAQQVDQQMAKVGERARALGNDISIPGASAATAALAMKELAKGGLSANQAMSAATGTLRLATAAQVDGGKAAQIQANALNAFRLSADQADHVADLLANAANSATGEVTDMASALQQSATVAAGFGISIDDTTTTLALFAKNGVLGSDAGTSFKTMLSQLASPTKQAQAALDTLGVTVYNAQGKFVGMEALTDQLARAKGRLTTAEYNAAASTAFGTDAIRAANILGQEGVRGWNNMEAAVTKAGGAQEMASAQTRGLTGGLDRFENAASTVALALFERLSPALQGVVDFGTGVVGTIGDIVGVLSNVPGPVWAGVTALGAMIILKGPLNALFLQAIAGYTRMAIAVRGASFSLAGIAVTAKAAWQAIGGPLGLAVIGVTTALSFMGSTTQDNTSYTADFTDAIDENTGALKENAPAIVRKALADSGALDAAEKGGVAIEDYTNAVVKQGSALDSVRTQIANHAVEILKQGGNYEKIQQQAQRAKMGTDDYILSILGSADASRGAEAGLSDLITVYSNLNRDAGTMETTQRRAGQALSGTGGAADDTAGSLDDLNSRLQETTDKFDPYKAALDAARDAAQEADSATTFLQNTLERMAGGQVTAEAAMRENEAAFRAIAAASRDSAEASQRVTEKQSEYDNVAAHLGTTLDGQAESATNLAVTQADVDRAARELADAQAAVSDASDRQFDANSKAAQSATEMAAQAYQAKAAQGDFAGGVADATRVMEDQRQKFVDAQAQINGGNIPAAEELANKYGLIPANVTTTFTQNGLDGALQQAKELNAQLDKADNRTIYYTAIGTSVVQYSAAAQGRDAQGNVIGGGASSTDSYLLDKLYGGHADGGWVFGAGGPREDKVAARLSPGEFVVRESQARKFGPLLEAMNAGLMGFAGGGVVPGGETSASAGAAVAVTAPDPAVFGSAWQAIADAAKAAWEQSILPVMDAMSQRDRDSGAEFTALAQLVQTQQQAVIVPAFTALNSGSEQVGVQAQALRDLWAQAWQAIQDKTSAVWGVVGGALFPAMAAGLAGLGVSQQQLSAATDGAWASIGARIRDSYSGQIVPAWQGVQGFTGAVGQLFADVQAGVAGATGQITGDIGEIRGALEGFFQVVDGRMTAAAADGGPVADVLQRFSDGGPVKSGTSRRADDVLIRVSRGEYVVNADAAARHLDTLEAINSGAYADGGLVVGIKDQIKDQMITGMQESVGAAVMKVLGALSSSVNVAGFTDSQDPSSFGWARAGNIVPFSWQGHPILGGVAAGTEGVWTALLSFLVPQIPGGLTQDLYGFENRDNVNSPGRASFHAYGLATDINAAANPNGVPIDARAGLGVIPAGPAREIAARLGMLWGGDFGGTPDSMHFELHVPPSAIGALGSGASPARIAPGGAWKQSLLDAIAKAKDAALVPPPSATTGNIAYTPSAGVEQWRGLLREVLSMLGQDTPANEAAGLLQIGTESSGNPNAVNLTDSNATVKGTPSKGLVQVIDPTFAAMRKYSPIELTNIWDPRQNLMAGALWAIHGHGSIAQGWRGVAYENGGVLPPGFTLAYNGTGNNEYTFTRDQLIGTQPAFDPSGFARAVETAVTKALSAHGRPGITVENINATSPGQALAEVEFALARAR